MAASRVKTKLEKSGELVAYSEGAIRNNVSIVEYCRTSMAALSGGTAGILGLTGLYGFIFYVFSVIGLWLLLLMKAGVNWQKYFVSRRTLLTNGFFGGLFISVWDGACVLMQEGHLTRSWRSHAMEQDNLQASVPNFPLF